MKKQFDVCIILDTSKSLEHFCAAICAAISTLIGNLKRANKEQDLKGIDVYLTLVCFSDDKKEILSFQPLLEIDENAVIKKITFGGQTNPAPAINYVVDSAIARYQQWGNEGIPRLKPCFFFFTDGNPYPVEKYSEPFLRAAKHVQELAEKKLLHSVVAGCGTVDPANLRKLTKNDCYVLRLEDTIADITNFFTGTIFGTLTHNTHTEEQFEIFFKNLQANR